MDSRVLYGSGFAYPFSWDETTGGVESVSAVDSVRASLMRLLDTAPGEEFMNPEYGCGLKYLVFEQDTDLFRALAETVIRQAVARWEPRVGEVVGVEIEEQDDATPNQVNIRIYFRLIESQAVDNFVYPFAVP